HQAVPHGAGHLADHPLPPKDFPIALQLPQALVRGEELPGFRHGGTPEERSGARTRPRPAASWTNSPLPQHRRRSDLCEARRRRPAPRREDRRAAPEPPRRAEREPPPRILSPRLAPR